MDMKDNNDMSDTDSEFKFDVDNDDFTVQLRQAYFSQFCLFSLIKKRT